MLSLSLRYEFVLHQRKKEFQSSYLKLVETVCWAFIYISTIIILYILVSAHRIMHRILYKQAKVCVFLKLFCRWFCLICHCAIADLERFCFQCVSTYLLTTIWLFNKYCCTLFRHNPQHQLDLIENHSHKNKSHTPYSLHSPRTNKICPPPKRKPDISNYFVHKSCNHLIALIDYRSETRKY